MVKTYRKVWINSLIKVSSCSLIKASFKNLMVYESTLNSTNLFIPVTHYLFINAKLSFKSFSSLYKYKK